MPRKITLFFSEVVDLYNKIPPARPTNNTRTPAMTPSNELSLISGWKLLQVMQKTLEDRCT